MKRKALTRVILYSTAIVLFVMILCGVLLGPRGYTRFSAAAEEATIPQTTIPQTTSPQDEPVAHGVTPGQVTVYRSPSTESQQVAVLEKDTTVAIMRQEDVGGEQWEYISSPFQGWIRSSQMMSASVEANLETIYATITADAVNVRSSPWGDAAIVCVLHSGEQVIIGRINSDDDTEWGFLTSPESGWINMEYVQITEAAEASPNQTETAASGGSQIVSQDTSVYASPSTEGTKISTIHAGSAVTFFRKENVAGEEWAYITAPQAGWISTEHVVTVESIPSDTVEAAAISTPKEVIMLQESEIYTAPTADADKVPLSQLYPGDTIRIGKTETVNGADWLYVDYPKTGWIPAESADISTPAVADVAGISAIVKEDLNVASAATMESNVAGSVAAGQEVTVNREVTFPNGEAWAFITAPAEGWIPVSKLSENPSAAELAFTMELEPAKVKDIEIEWAAGNILIEPIATDQILIREDPAESGKNAMVWKHEGSKLSIDFCEEDSIKLFGFSDNTVTSKDLTIYVPKNWKCNSLEIDAAKAALTVKELTIREVEIDTASGDCTFNDCVVDSLDLDTASGDVHFVGELKEFDCDAASASIQAILFNVPSRLDMDTMSGDLDISLPENAGFTLTMNAMNADLTSEFDTTIKNGSYVAGNGSCRINVDAMSSNVFLRKR